MKTCTARNSGLLSLSVVRSKIHAAITINGGERDWRLAEVSDVQGVILYDLEMLVIVSPRSSMADTEKMIRRRKCQWG